MSFLKNLMEQGLTSANEVKEIFMTPKEKAANYKAVREACEAKLKQIGPSIDQLKGWGKVIESLRAALNKLNKDGVVDVAEAKKAMAKVLSEALLEHMNPIVVRRFVELVEEDDDKEDDKDEKKSDDKDEKSDKDDKKDDEKSDDKDDSKEKSEKSDDKEDNDKDDKKEESLDSISADDFFGSTQESDDDIVDELNEGSIEESKKGASKFAKSLDSQLFAREVYDRVLSSGVDKKRFHSIVKYAMEVFESKKGMARAVEDYVQKALGSNYEVSSLRSDSGFVDRSGYHSSASDHIFSVYLEIEGDYVFDQADILKIHRTLTKSSPLQRLGAKFNFNPSAKSLGRMLTVDSVSVEVDLFTDFDYEGMHKWMRDSVLSESLDDEQDPLKEWLKSQEHSMCKEEFKDFQESLDEAKASMTPTEYTEHLLDLKEKQQMKLGDVVANAKKFIKQSSLIQSKIGSYKNPYVRELVEKSFLHFIKNGHIDYFAMDGILLSATRPAAKKLTQKVRQRFKTLKVSVTESTVAGASYSFTLKPKGKDSLDMVEVDRVKAMIEREGFKVLSYSNSASSLDVFEEIFDVEFVPGYYENRMRKSLKDAITETAFKAYKFETTESAEFAEAEEAFDAVTEACLEFYEMSDEDRAALSDEDRADYIASLESYFVLSELAECDEEDEDEESTEESVESDEGFGLDEATQVVKVRRNSANRKKTRAARTKGRAKKKASQKKLNRRTKGKSVRQKRKIAARLKAKSKGISVKQAAMQNKMGRAKAKSRRAGGKAVVVRGNNLYAGLIDDLESKSVTEAIREVLPKLESQFTVETESLKESVIAQDVAATLTLGFEKLIAESSALMESLHEKEMDNDARIEAMTSLEGLIRDAESMLSGANATFEEASKTLLGLCEQFEETQEIA